MNAERSRRGPTAALAVLAVVGVALAGAVVTRLAVEETAPRNDETTVPTVRWSENVGRALPRPQDARPAERPEDPGGALQVLLLGVVVAGLATIGVLVVRQARRAGTGSDDPSGHAGVSRSG